MVRNQSAKTGKGPRVVANKQNADEQVLSASIFPENENVIGSEREL